jgi:hypothetical protein
MSTNIKFIIGSEQDINTLLFISKAIAREKYADIVAKDRLEAYIHENFNENVLYGEINDMSNQFLVVYADGEPAGYARITSKGRRPEIFYGKPMANITAFGILKKITDGDTKKHLFEKCLSACCRQQTIWISDYSGNADTEFFESYGFSKNEAITCSHELALKPVYLVKV